MKFSIVIIYKYFFNDRSIFSLYYIKKISLVLKRPFELSFTHEFFNKIKKKFKEKFLLIAQYIY